MSSKYNTSTSFRFQLKASIENTFDFEVELQNNLKNGIYILTILSGDKGYNCKLIIEE